MKRADISFARLSPIHLLGWVFALTLLFSCERDYQAPPLTEPQYNGKEANITIAKLKSLYATVTEPKLIDVEYIIKATVIGNDISGNIYKQLYIQDETGGINMGVDQNSIYTEYRVGQEIYVNLKGLYMVSYGEQLQIGYAQTNANRIPWEVFNFYVQKNKWPKNENAIPKTIKLTDLNDALVNTLVRFENVYFVDGGKLPFSDTDATTNRVLKDGDGNSILVRNSNYASFAANMLPEGGGNLVGVLSKFRSDWQFYIRSIDDCENFGQPIPGGTTPTNPDEKTYFSETFGSENLSSPWPFIADYKGFDVATVTYSDASKKSTVRKISAAAWSTLHVWFPANADSYLTIEGIDTSSAGEEEVLALRFDIAASLFNAADAMDLNAMEVIVDGKTMEIPSQPVSNGNGDNNKTYTITLKEIPAKKDLKVEFHAKAEENKFGLRLDNVSIITATDDVIIVKPS